MITLCYGMTLKAHDLAVGNELPLGRIRRKTCAFCGKRSQGDANYCYNCGKDIKKPANVSTADMVDLLTSRHPPPRGVEVLPLGEDVAVCQVIARGKVAMSAIPPSRHAWDVVRPVLCEYARRIGAEPSRPDHSPRLFAFGS